MRLKPEKIANYVGKEDLSLVDAMEKIDRNAKGILFIVDSNEKLVGSLTDGDIRRWIIKSGDVSVPVKKAMNSLPIFLFFSEKRNAYDLMKKKMITSIPIVDEQKRLVDICFWASRESDNMERESLVGVPAIIMAGGMGTRLYPYTKILPKPLVPIGDTPIVERIIDYYTGFGIKNFYMTVNYKKAMIRSYFDDVVKDYDIYYVEEDKPLGTGGSIRLIKDKFDKPVFVTNCDALILADYYDIYQYHMNSGNDITMVSALKNIQVPYGVMHTGENGVLVSMEEKPKISYFINTGMYIINPGTIDMIPEDTMFHMTQLVEKVMESGGKVGTYPVSEDSFLDMGELSEMRRMEEKLGISVDKGRDE